MLILILMPSKVPVKKKEKISSMPTEAQIDSAGKELEKMPPGEVIVRKGFKFALTEDGHITFQKE